MSRELAALLVAAFYGALCLVVYARERHRLRLARQEAASLLSAAGGSVPMLVLHGSQTGQAEELAWQAARWLHAAGVPVRLAALAGIRRADLRAVTRALFITSTYGEGDPPDGAAIFVHDVMGEADAPDLGGLHVGILALGDKNYDHFCGFGRALDEWLRRQGARAMFERIDVDKTDSVALMQWRHQLSHLAGTTDLPDWEAPVFESWRLAARRHLNPGSRGAPAFHLELEPAQQVALPHWEAGDLAQVQLPVDPDRPREYSIASLPQDGRLHLLVRQAISQDGSMGLVSGWLTQAVVGETVPLRLRAHASFRLDGNAMRPLILIGNGTGMAGLRAHLKARAQSGTRAGVWLVFGEREAAHDAFYREDIEAWLADGTLTCMNWVFSRDQEEKRYVQDALREAAGMLRAWAGNDAAIYVCGSLDGMARDVDKALNEILGAGTMRRLIEQGRYRRDVY